LSSITIARPQCAMPQFGIGLGHRLEGSEAACDQAKEW
jgi:hypothetical protein